MYPPASKIKGTFGGHVDIGPGQAANATVAAMKVMAKVACFQFMLMIVSLRSISNSSNRLAVHCKGYQASPRFCLA